MDNHNTAGVDLDKPAPFSDAELNELESVARAAPSIWYGTYQIVDGISDEKAVELVEACSPDTILTLVAQARAARPAASEAPSIGLSPVYAWRQRSAHSGISEVSDAAYVLMAYYQGAEFPEPSAKQAAPEAHAGYKLVPIEPTPEMLMNVDIEVGNVQWDHSQAVVTEDEARDIWKQMIAASPAVSQQAAYEAPMLIQALETGDDRESSRWFDIHPSEIATYVEEGYKVRKLYEYAPAVSQKDGAALVTDENAPGYRPPCCDGGGFDSTCCNDGCAADRELKEMGFTLTDRAATTASGCPSCNDVGWPDGEGGLMECPTCGHAPSTKPTTASASPKKRPVEDMLMPDWATNPEYYRAPSPSREAAAALQKLCDQIDGMRRTMFLRPGTGQNYSYLVHEDVAAYIEEARAAIASSAAQEAK